MDIQECIIKIRKANELKNNGIEMSIEETYIEKDAYDFLFKRMQHHINYLISKNNYLPGMTRNDIEQELRIHLLDSIISRKSKRVRINKETGEKNIMKTIVNVEQTPDKIENYLKFSLSHKYYRLSRDFYVHDKETHKKIVDNKNKGLDQRGMYKTFKEPLNNFCLSITSNADESSEDYGKINEDNEIMLSNGFADSSDITNEVQLNSIKKRISKEARTVLELALGCNKPIDFLRYIKQRGDARRALELEIIPILEQYYGIKEKFNGRVKRKKQNSKTNIHN